MKHLTVLLILILWVTASCGCISHGETGPHEILITQSDGTTVILPHTAQRIIVTNSNIVEILAIMGDTDKIVGAGDAVITNPEIGPLLPENVTNVGRWIAPDIETILQLKPDVLIAYSSLKPKNADLIASAGIPILYIDCYKPDTLDQDVRSLGLLTGDPDGADRYLTLYHSVIDEITERLNAAPNLTRRIVYAENFHDYHAQGTGSGGDLLIRIAGGTNIMENASGGSAPVVSNEWIVAADPEVIIKISSSTETMDGPAEYQKLISRTGFSHMTAVTSENTWIVSAKITYGPRCFIGALAFAKILHPDLFADLSLDDLISRYAAAGFLPDHPREHLVYPDLG